MSSIVNTYPKLRKTKNTTTSLESKNINILLNTNTNIFGDVLLAFQSFPAQTTHLNCSDFDICKKFEQSLEKSLKKSSKRKHFDIKAIENLSLNKKQKEFLLKHSCDDDKYINLKNDFTRKRCESENNDVNSRNNERRTSELVDQLLLDIYGRSVNSEKCIETDYYSSSSFKSLYYKFDVQLQSARLVKKDVTEMQILISALTERVQYTGNILIKQLKKRDALKSKKEKLCNVITAHLQAHSCKRSEDTNMRFSPTPVPGDSGFNQWRDAMRMVAKLPGGIPQEFRRKLWLSLAEKHLQKNGVNWTQTEKLCFNEWSNPDDSELGVQIVKDLHRTGCSLFCGTAGQENQALLKRVLLAYARWNKNVGYCQGFNMLAALILQVMDRSEVDSVKVMIYLIEGVLPESYFANNLHGLSVDMIVFRDLLKMRLPQLSRHLEMLQNDAREGNSFEPPLTNVFTMQWFLTLFCNCLPQSTVLRVWDLIFLEGNEILLRTAIAIWERLSDRILAVNSADEFYSIMGVLTREMLEFGFVDSNTLVKSIVSIGVCAELNEMRDKYLYNITPWTQSVQSAAKKGFRLFYSDDDEVESDNDEKAAVTAAYGLAIGRKKDKTSSSSTGNVIQPYAHGHPDRERLALDISALKKQYARLRERQRQAHIILQAACARQPIGQNTAASPIAMNHLLLGKNAIVNSRGRRLGPPKGAIPPARIQQQIINTDKGETIHWKDTKLKSPKKQDYDDATEEKTSSADTSDSSSYSEDDSSSSSTELCDDLDRLSDSENDDKPSDFSLETLASPTNLKSPRTVKELKNNKNIKTFQTEESSDKKITNELISKLTSVNIADNNNDKNVENDKITQSDECTQSDKSTSDKKDDISSLNMFSNKLCVGSSANLNSSDLCDSNVGSIAETTFDSILRGSPVNISRSFQASNINVIEKTAVLEPKKLFSLENENYFAEIVSEDLIFDKENIEIKQVLEEKFETVLQTHDSNNKETEMEKYLSVNKNFISGQNVITNTENEKQMNTVCIKNEQEIPVAELDAKKIEEILISDNVKQSFLLMEKTEEVLTSIDKNLDEISTNFDRNLPKPTENIFERNVDADKFNDSSCFAEEENVLDETIIKHIPDSVENSQTNENFLTEVCSLESKHDENINEGLTTTDKYEVEVVDFDKFLEDRILMLKQTSFESGNEDSLWKENLRRIKSYDETTLGLSKKTTIFKQKSIDIPPNINAVDEQKAENDKMSDGFCQNVLDKELEEVQEEDFATGNCNTKIRNEMSGVEFFDEIKYDTRLDDLSQTEENFKFKIEDDKDDVIVINDEKEHEFLPDLFEIKVDDVKLNKIKIDVELCDDNNKIIIVKQKSVDLLTVEDKKFDLSRRNSERALKIIQENSMILHRILQHSKSSDKEDSDEESRSPVKKHFTQSNSPLLKDNKDKESEDTTDKKEHESIAHARENESKQDRISATHDSTTELTKGFNTKTYKAIDQQYTMFNKIDEISDTDINIYAKHNSDLEKSKPIPLETTNTIDDKKFTEKRTETAEAKPYSTNENESTNTETFSNTFKLEMEDTTQDSSFTQILKTETNPIASISMSNNCNKNEFLPRNHTNNIEINSLEMEQNIDEFNLTQTDFDYSNCNTSKLLTMKGIELIENDSEIIDPNISKTIFARQLSDYEKSDLVSDQTQINENILLKIDESFSDPVYKSTDIADDFRKIKQKTTALSHDENFTDLIYNRVKLSPNDDFTSKGTQITDNLTVKSDQIYEDSLLLISKSPDKLEKDGFYNLKGSATNDNSQKNDYSYGETNFESALDRTSILNKYSKDEMEMSYFETDLDKTLDSISSLSSSEKKSEHEKSPVSSNNYYTDELNSKENETVLTATSNDKDNEFSTKPVTLCYSNASLSDQSSPNSSTYTDYHLAITPCYHNEALNTKLSPNKSFDTEVTEVTERFSPEFHFNYDLKYTPKFTSPHDDPNLITQLSSNVVTDMQKLEENNDAMNKYATNNEIVNVTTFEKQHSDYKEIQVCDVANLKLENVAEIKEKRLEKETSNEKMYLYSPITPIDQTNYFIKKYHSSDDQDIKNIPEITDKGTVEEDNIKFGLDNTIFTDTNMDAFKEERITERGRSINEELISANSTNKGEAGEPSYFYVSSDTSKMSYTSEFLEDFCENSKNEKSCTNKLEFEEISTENNGIRTKTSCFLSPDKRKNYMSSENHDDDYKYTWQCFQKYEEQHFNESHNNNSLKSPSNKREQDKPRKKKGKYKYIPDTPVEDVRHVRKNKNLTKAEDDVIYTYTKDTIEQKHNNYKEKSVKEKRLETPDWLRFEPGTKPHQEQETNPEQDNQRSLQTTKQYTDFLITTPTNDSNDDFANTNLTKYKNSKTYLYDLTNSERSQEATTYKTDKTFYGELRKDGIDFKNNFLTRDKELESNSDNEQYLFKSREINVENDELHFKKLSNKSPGSYNEEKIDNNLYISAQNSPETYNRNNLSLELSSTVQEESSPDETVPKSLSCLQFTPFNTELPCSSKFSHYSSKLSPCTSKFSPICRKDTSDISPTNFVKSKTENKYFTSLNLPTLSPPRKMVKTPLTPEKSFNPFPVQPTTRQPKDLARKLGLYRDYSPIKSPSK